MFDPDGIARVGERARAQIEAVLRAVGDEHLLRIAADAARHAQIFGDRLPQPQIAAERRVTELRRTDSPPCALDRAPPRRERKLVERGHARQERQRLALVVGVDVRQPGDAPRERGPRVRGRGGRARRGQPYTRDHRALPPRDDEALGGEPLVGVEHRVARDPQRLGERARRHQIRAGFERAVQDRRAQARVEPVLLRRARERVARGVPFEVRQQHTVVHRGSKIQ